MTALLAFMLVAGTVPALSQTLDRVVASAGNVAVTESDVEAQDRFEAFLGEPRPPATRGAPEFDRVRDRLVDQKLLSQEANSDGLQREDFSAAAADRLAEIRKRYKTEAALEAAFRGLGMTQQQLLDRLAEQQRILRLIDQRLRPNAVVEESEVQAYYRNKFLPQLPKRPDDPPPALAEVEHEIREILVQEKINKLLSDWLQQLRISHRVKIHDF